MPKEPIFIPKITFYSISPIGLFSGSLDLNILLLFFRKMEANTIPIDFVTETAARTILKDHIESSSLVPFELLF